MELKQRKRINNLSLLEHFDTGKLNGDINYNQFSGINGLGNLSLNGYNLPDATQYWNSVQHNTGSLGAVGSNPFLKQTNQSIANSQQITGNLPVKQSSGNPPVKQSSGFGDFTSKAGGIALGIVGAVNIIGANSAANASVKDVSELQADAGTTERIGSGYSWTSLNNVNRSAAMKELSQTNMRTTVGMVGSGAAAGAALGSVIPIIGTGIGALGGAIIGGLTGIIGGRSRRNKLRKRLFNALQQIQRNNEYYQSSALSDYLAQQYDLNHENTQDDAIYTAKHGKDLRLPILRK